MLDTLGVLAVQCRIQKGRQGPAAIGARSGSWSAPRRSRRSASRGPEPGGTGHGQVEVEVEVEVKKEAEVEVKVEKEFPTAQTTRFIKMNPRRSREEAEVEAEVKVEVKVEKEDRAREKQRAQVTRFIKMNPRRWQRDTSFQFAGTRATKNLEPRTTNPPPEPKSRGS